MSYHLRVLQSIVRLSHSTAAPSRAALLTRAGGTDSALDDALDELVTLGLVQSSASHERLSLTLAGLAVGTAYAAQAARARDEAEEAKAVEEPHRLARTAPRERRVARQARNGRGAGAARSVTARVANRAA